MMNQTENPSGADEAPPPALPAPEDHTAPAEETAAPAEPPRTRRDPLPYFFGAGVLVLIAAVVFLWLHPIHMGVHKEKQQPSPVEVLQQQVQALQKQTADLQSQVTALQNKPAPVAPPAPNLKPLEDRIAALENKKPPQAPDVQPEFDKLGKRVDALANKADELTTHQQQFSARLDADETKLGQDEAKQAQDETKLGQALGEADKVSALANRAGHLARVQAAEAALAAGQPLGDLANAPPALTRFASAAPPTEAALKLEFPQVADAALAAATPETADKSVWQAMKARAESLITIRRGDNVIVGDPASGTIARAQQALDAGDLAGAVAALGTLKGPPAEAVAAWKAKAQSLLDARAALATMAAHA